MDLFSFNLKKLDGIQEGIKVFEGLNIKEIALILTSLGEIAVNRGCKNNCSHCYADAKPSIRPNETHTGKMLWEDFISLVGGIKELNNRLGFYSTGQQAVGIGRYYSPFHDSDSVDIVLKDKQGNEHNYIDITNLLGTVLALPVVFDTSGWSPNDKKAQARAEEAAEYYSKPENEKKLFQFNISFNPFHSLHSKEVERRKAGDNEVADKLRDLYTTRMANTIFTMTPMLKSEKFDFLTSCIWDDDSYDGFREEDLDELFDETIVKLKKMYQKDFETEQKFIHTKTELTSYLNKVKKHYTSIAPRTISFTDKALRTFGSDNEFYDGLVEEIKKDKEYLKTHNIEECRYMLDGMIDANGDFYLTNYYMTIPTEIRLNFSEKRKTPPIAPNLTPELIIKKQDLEL